MRLLLDTHVVIRAAADPDRLGALADLLTDPRNETLVSAVTAWEVVLKHAVGRLELPDEPASWFRRSVRELAATLVDVEADHALAVARLPDVHADPFDRLLVAQAVMLGVPLATTDTVLADYPVDTLSP